jgi:serine phosphatase RsbU (regulator of sigma subunit)
MKTLVEAFRLVSVSLDLDETLKAILDGLKSLVDYDAAGIYVIQPKTGELRAHTVQGYPENTSQFELIPKGKGVVGRVLEAGTPLLIDDVTSDPNYIEARPTTQSEIAAPIIGSGERIIGVLNLESDVKNAYGPVALELVTLFASGVAMAIEKATLHAEMMDKRRLESEITVARQVMDGLLPRQVPELDSLDIAAINKPWHEVGGDYYDFIPIDNERWGIVVADVVGKGVSAALLVSSLRASLHSLARSELALRSVFRKANQFFRESFSEGQFVTVFCVELDVKTRRLIYINAGHPPPVLWRAGGTVEFLEGGGAPVGLLAEPGYKEEFAELRSGDVLAIYTDGISEAYDTTGEEYGTDRLATTIARSSAADAAAICHAVVKDVTHFSGPQGFDDRTLVIIKAL